MISGEFTINEVANANGAGQQKPSKKSAQARIEHSRLRAWMFPTTSLWAKR